jgi:hypothetical protein
MRRALLDVARHVQEAEPGTRAFFVSQDTGDGRIFTTNVRAVHRSGGDRHDGSAAVARFFATAKPILDGEVVLHAMKSIEIDRSRRLIDQPGTGHDRGHPDIPPILEVVTAFILEGIFDR